MNAKFQNILILFCLAFPGFVTGVMAQESLMPELEIVDPERDCSDREKMLYSPGETELRYIPKTPPPVKETNSTTNSSSQAGKYKTEKPAPTPKPTVNKQSKNENESSILTFNFLYYIIQKYKLQDIVD